MSKDGTQYAVTTPRLLSTAHNADGSVISSIGPQTLLTLPSGEEVSILRAQSLGLIKREYDSRTGTWGRYYEVDPITRATPTLSDALFEAESKIEQYQQDMPAGSSGKLYSELEDVKQAIRKLRRKLDAA